MLALSVYVEVAPGIIISPGSAILFTAGLFAILLVYIREDALEARRLIYGLVLANATISGITWLFGLHLLGPRARNLLDLSPELFTRNPQVLLVGTGALLIDVILIIVLYEATFKLFPRSFAARAFLSMTAVLVLDGMIFIADSFWGHPPTSRS